jgi:5-methylcytosine-specific restriction enzyme A
MVLLMLMYRLCVRDDDMALKALKPCKAIRCPNLTREGYCEQHKIEPQQQKKEANKQYDRYKRDERSTKFYKSKAWRELRTLAYNRDNGLCLHCLRNNIFKRADVVDHIVEIKDDWDKRLDISNLQSLCHGCHNRKTRGKKA